MHPTSPPSFVSHLLVVGALFLTTPNAHAALTDDVPSCRCIEDLTLADTEGISEDIRREALRIRDDYCEENQPLSELAGQAQWIADESCRLLHQEFLGDTEILEDLPEAQALEVRLSIQTMYDARRLIQDDVVDWRHHLTVYARMHFTFRPAKMRAMYGGAQ